MTDQNMPFDQSALFENGHLRLRRCRHGVMLYNLNDVYIGTALDLYGEFSEGENELFRQVLRPGMTVVEVGANIGVHTIPMAQCIGPRGRLLAFEPQRAVFQVLCANVALNGVEQVEAHWAALGSTDGFISVPRLDSTARQNFGGLAIGEANGEKVRLATLDSLDLPACHFIKIDVEGMEIEVIRGAVETIRRHVPLIYAENDRQERSPMLIEQLFALDYRCFWHAPPLVRVPNYRANLDNKFPGIVSFNMICVPRSRNIPVHGLREVESKNSQR
jgi:FkbM family methyltransferase